MKRLSDIKFSTLDLVPVRENSSAAQSLHNPLDLAQHVENPLIRIAQRHGDANCGIGLVAVGVCRQSRVVLRDPAEVAETSAPVIAGSRIDAGQVYGHEQNGTGPTSLAD